MFIPTPIILIITIILIILFFTYLISLAENNSELTIINGGTLALLIISVASIATWSYSTDPEYTHSEFYEIETVVYKDKSSEQFITIDNEKINITRIFEKFLNSEVHCIEIKKYNYKVNNLRLLENTRKYNIKVKESIDE